MVVLDTNIVIDYIRRPDFNNSGLVRLIKSELPQNLAISIITIQELYIGQSSKVAEKEEFFLTITESLKILPYEYKIAKLAGEIMRDVKSTLGFADAAIAATTIINNAALLTLNIKDFEKIKGLKFASV